MIDPALYNKYPKEKVDAAIDLLTYKKVDPLPKIESDSPPIMYIFRHGESIDNANFVFSGWRTAPITQKGREQAEVLANKLKTKKIHMLISSPQTRALETMKIAMSQNPYAKTLDITTDERLKERSYGNLQGKSKLEMFLDNPDLLKSYRRSYTKKAEGGESLEDVVKRIFDFCGGVVPLMKKEKINIAISCHGNSIRGFRAFFENLSPKQICEIETPLGQDYASYDIS